MSLNLKRVQLMLQKDLTKNFEKIRFQYEIDDNMLRVAADISIQGLSNDISYVIDAYSGGLVSFRAIFGKVKQALELLVAINQFNDSQMFFKAFHRDDLFVEFSNSFFIEDESAIRNYGAEFLSRLIGLAKDEGALRITYYMDRLANMNDNKESDEEN